MPDHGFRQLAGGFQPLWLTVPENRIDSSFHQVCAVVFSNAASAGNSDFGFLWHCPVMA
jgi:hypothetical protein